jgi:hypothetical protein
MILDAFGDVLSIGWAAGSCPPLGGAPVLAIFMVLDAFGDVLSIGWLLNGKNLERPHGRGLGVRALSGCRGEDAGARPISVRLGEDACAIWLFGCSRDRGEDAGVPPISVRAIWLFGIRPGRPAGPSPSP